MVYRLSTEIIFQCRLSFRFIFQWRLALWLILFFQQRPAIFTCFGSTLSIF